MNSKPKYFIYDNTVRILILCYITFYCFICFLKFRSYAYYDFDLALYTQALWSILHGSTHSSILGISFLGNHAHLIFFIIAPIYYIFSSSLTLLILQTLALGLSAWPLYLIARDILNAKWGMAISFIYLIYPGLGFTNLYEYHPTVFATLFLAWMLYYFHKERFFYFMVFIFLSMLCQENIPFVAISIGIYALFCKRHLKWFFWSFMSGIIYFYLAVFVIITYFNHDTIQFISIYSRFGDSYAGIAGNIIFNPWQTLQFMLMEHKISYLVQVFLPLSFIPLLSPCAMVLSLPYFLQHLLSGRFSETTIYHHYLAEMLPLIFFAFISGIRNILKMTFLRSYQNSFIICLVGIALVSHLFHGPLPEIFVSKSTLIRDENALIRDDFVGKIPPHAGIVATFRFLPHLTQRKNLYSFHHVYSGYYTLSNRPYKLPEDATYALIDFDDPLTFKGFYHPDNYENLLEFLSDGRWGITKVYDSIVLFEKGKNDLSLLYEVLPNAPDSVLDNRWLIDESIELAYYELHDKAAAILAIDFYWHAVSDVKKDIIVFFDIVDSNGMIVARLIRPICYRIYPTNAWCKGEWIRESKYLPMPYRLRPGRYSLIMGFLSFDRKEVFIVNPKDAQGRIFIGYFNIALDTFDNRYCA
jgi:uncharacterized membrane protein